MDLFEGQTVNIEDGPARQEAQRKNEEEINGCSKREH